MKKKSYEDVYEFFKSMGYELLDKVYIGSGVGMNCIDSDGYKLSIKYASLKSGTTPSRFHTDNPYTIENIKNYIKLNRENVELVDGQEYIGNNKKLIFKCLIHNEEFPMGWDGFHCGSGCPRCANEHRNDAVRKPVEDIIKCFENNGYNSLKYEHLNSKTKIECDDSEGYKYFISYRDIIGASKPIRFNKSNPHTIENIHHYIKLNRDKIELVEGQEYIGHGEYLIFKCLIHNEYFPCTWMSFKRGSGCPRCGIDAISGENSYRWKGGISNLSEYLRHKIQPWKNDSFAKYNGKCDITGLRDSNIIHHLHPFALILKETMNTLNLSIYQEVNKYTFEELKSIEDLCLELHYKYGLGVCLTDKIHTELHLHYGGHIYEIDEQQYYSFKEIKLK